jgi:hypothetical protein
MGQYELSGHGPTHVCPRCGEWWDVEGGGMDLWYVAIHDNEEAVSSQVWTETAIAPVCPEDQATLSSFCIID